MSEIAGDEEKKDSVGTQEGQGDASARSARSIEDADYLGSASEVAIKQEPTAEIGAEPNLEATIQEQIF